MPTSGIITMAQALFMLYILPAQAVMWEYKGRAGEKSVPHLANQCVTVSVINNHFPKILPLNKNHVILAWFFRWNEKQAILLPSWFFPYKFCMHWPVQLNLIKKLSLKDALSRNLESPQSTTWKAILRSCTLVWPACFKETLNYNCVPFPDPVF